MAILNHTNCRARLSQACNVVAACCRFCANKEKTAPILGLQACFAARAGHVHNRDLPPKQAALKVS